jgi:hypothetical protein
MLPGKQTGIIVRWLTGIHTVLRFDHDPGIPGRSSTVEIRGIETKLAGTCLATAGAKASLPK